ncbi:MAG: endonuclease domain-containing protein [Clostridia bacterium]|nr:endonuclease domain-containing protein [Clostridia bacterium]
MADAFLTKRAQELRKNMTPEERKLWHLFLKTLPVTVNRQKICGPYIVDFYCAAAKTVIEIDGSQHFETENQEKDKQRDIYFKENNIRVLRFSNRKINEQFDAVCEAINTHLNIYSQ